MKISVELSAGEINAWKFKNTCYKQHFLTKMLETRL